MFFSIPVIVIVKEEIICENFEAKLFYSETTEAKRFFSETKRNLRSETKRNEAKLLICGFAKLKRNEAKPFLFR